jgi:hypothetical protein
VIRCVHFTFTLERRLTKRCSMKKERKGGGSLNGAQHTLAGVAPATANGQALTPPSHPRELRTKVREVARLSWKEVVRAYISYRS